jgi:outer membrane protein OmpU
MKKLLIASTALVATAGMAAADVTLSGYAEMGISDQGAGVEMHHDFDVKFSLSGETDGGLTFGATMDLDEQLGGTSPSANSSSVWIKGGFGNLTLGDTDGAFDWALTEAIIGSAIADDHEHAGYNGNSGLDGTFDGQVLRYDNTFGDFGVALSYEMNDADTAAGDAVGLGVKYTADLGGASIALGLGYQENDLTSGVGISAKTSISGFDIIANYTDTDSGATHTGLAIGYTVGELLVAANWGEFDFGGGVKSSGFGLVANYDLGGGAKVMAAYGDSDVAGVGSDTFSLGLGLSF